VNVVLRESAISMNGPVKRGEFLPGSAAAVGGGRAWGQKRISVLGFGFDPKPSLEAMRTPTLP